MELNIHRDMRGRYRAPCPVCSGLDHRRPKLLKARSKKNLWRSLLSHITKVHDQHDLEVARISLDEITSKIDLGTNFIPRSAKTCKCGRRADYVFNNKGLCRYCYERWDSVWCI